MNLYARVCEGQSRVYPVGGPRCWDFLQPSVTLRGQVDNG